MRPQEIQVGILKRLRGTPIVRHDTEWQMVYNPHPPYEILQNKLVDFATMQKLRRFAKYWDLVGNSGNFVATTPLIWENSSPFASLMRFSEWLHLRAGRTDSIALARLMEWLFEFLTTEIKSGAHPVAEALWTDYQRGGRHDRPSLPSRIPARRRNCCAIPANGFVETAVAAFGPEQMNFRACRNYVSVPVYRHNEC